MVTRKEIRSPLFSPEELLALRRAMIVFQAKNGPGSYIDIAGYHGIPWFLCHKDPRIFLPWHRMYVAYFEAELRKIDSTVSLPYWDWTSAESLQTGLAPAHSDPEFFDNAQMPNPLFSGPIEDRSRNTERRCKPIGRLADYSRAVALAYIKSTDYSTFNLHIAAPHASIHTWVSGHMGNAERAAYDPLFWSHHANVDRQWALWQYRHPGDVVPVLNEPLPGFPGKHVRDVINYMELGYTYEDLQAGGPGLFAQLQQLDNLQHDLPKLTIVEISIIDMPQDSITVDLFVINKTTSERVFGGSFGIFGMGHRHEAASLEHEHHTAVKAIQLMDISEAARQLRTSSNIEISLKGLTLHGREVKQSELPISDIKINAANSP